MITKITKSKNGKKLNLIKFEIDGNVYIMNTNHKRGNWTLSIVPNKKKKSPGLKYTRRNGEDYMLFWKDGKTITLNGFHMKPEEQTVAKLKYGNLEFANWAELGKDISKLDTGNYFNVPVLPKLK